MTIIILKKQNMKRNSENDESMDDMAIEDWLANHIVERKTTSFPPPKLEDGTNESTVMRNVVVPESNEDDNDDLEEPVMEATTERAEPRLMTNGDIFVPTVFTTTTLPKSHTLIEGVNVGHIKRRTFYIIMGCLVLAIFIAVITAMIITRWLVHSDHSNQTSVALSPENNATTISPTGSPINKGNTSWTIAEYIFNDSKNGNGVSLTQAASGLWILNSVLNRTDINLTFFRISQAANIQGIDIPLISKFALPLWHGHTVSGVHFSILCSRDSATTHPAFSILHSTEEYTEKCYC